MATHSGPHHSTFPLVTDIVIGMSRINESKPGLLDGKSVTEIREILARTGINMSGVTSMTSAKYIYRTAAKLGITVRRPRLTGAATRSDLSAKIQKLNDRIEELHSTARQLRLKITTLEDTLERLEEVVTR